MDSNYSVRHGEKTIPIPVILDEAQNLDHRESHHQHNFNRRKKIWLVGRYATQFKSTIHR